MDRDMVELMVALDNEMARALDEIASLLADGTDRRAAAAEAIRLGQGPLRLAADAKAAEAVAVCPRCQGALNRLDVAAIVLRGCADCGGIWIGHRSGRELLETLNWNVCKVAERARDGASTRPDVSSAIACPACGEATARMLRDGVHIDMCERHGTWFDAGELVTVMQRRRRAQRGDLVVDTGVVDHEARRLARAARIDVDRIVGPFWL